MKEISQKTVDSILENAYFGYGKKATTGHPNISGGTTNVNLGNGNKWDVPIKTGNGKGQDQENQGKGGGDGGVTADQTAGYDAASKAGPGNDTFSHEAEQMPAEKAMSADDPTKGGAGSMDLGYTADGGNVTGVNLGNGNKWEMPSSTPAGSGQDKGETTPKASNIKVFPIKDHQEISTEDRLQKLEEAIVNILEKVTAIHRLEEVKSGRDKSKDIPNSAKDVTVKDKKDKFDDAGNQQNGYPEPLDPDKAVGFEASNVVDADYGQPGKTYTKGKKGKKAKKAKKSKN